MCLNLAFSIHLQDESEQLFSSTCWTWGDTELQWADRAVLLLHWIIKSLKYSVTEQRLCLLKSYCFVQHVLYNCITKWTIWYYFLFWDFNTRVGGRRIWSPKPWHLNISNHNQICFCCLENTPLQWGLFRWLDSVCVLWELSWIEWTWIISGSDISYQSCFFYIVLYYNIYYLMALFRLILSDMTILQVRNPKVHTMSKHIQWKVNFFLPGRNFWYNQTQDVQHYSNDDDDDDNDNDNGGCWTSVADLDPVASRCLRSQDRQGGKSQAKVEERQTVNGMQSCYINAWREEERQKKTSVQHGSSPSNFAL